LISSPDHWRWLLTDVQGSFVADRDVALDLAEPEYQAFVDLAGSLSYRAVPDQRLASEAELVGRMSGWVGRLVLGEQIGEALVPASPVVAEVMLPVSGDSLLCRPLERAHVDGMRLTRQDMTLVSQVDGEAASEPIDVVMAFLPQFLMSPAWSIDAIITVFSFRR